MKVVRVTWEDPCFARSGWVTQAEFEDFLQRGLSPADSVGMLAYEGPAYIVLLQSIGENTVADAVKISRSAIRSIQEIGEVPISLDLPATES